jgi:transcriptional regulator with XRE-family HTH domain
MKKYHSLGELLLEYRQIHKLTQSDFAIKLNADIRTIQRWEKNETNINEEKVADLVEGTLLPFQLIRNLNATNPIPTYFDFKTHKYSLSTLAIDLPDAKYFRDKLDVTTSRIRAIDLSYDFDYLIESLEIPKPHLHSIKEVLREATLLLPEMNLIIIDELGYYDGFSLVLPLTEKGYQLLRERKIIKNELKIEHITDYKFQSKPIFFTFKIIGYNNDDMQFLIGTILSFFKKMNDKDYLIGGYGDREDAYQFPNELELKIIWREETGQFGNKFYEGDFKEFFREK